MNTASFPAFFYAGAALLLGSCAGSSDRGRTVCSARLPLAPGRTYYYAIREESRTLSDEKGAKVMRTNGVSLALHCTASPEGAAGARLRIVCDTLSLHEHSDGGELNMDAASALESGDPGVRMLAAFHGAELGGCMDTQGRLTGLSGLEGVYRRMAELGKEPGEDHSGRAISWQRQLDPVFFVSLMEKAWHIYPDAGIAGPVSLAIGNSWVLPDSLDADSHIPLETTYTLVRARNGILRFATRADVDIRERRLDKTYRNGQITLKGKQVGFLDVVAATGMVLDGQSTLRAEGSLRMGEISIPMIIDSTYTVTALRS